MTSTDDLAALAADIAALEALAGALGDRSLSEIDGPSAAAAHRRVRGACDRLVAVAARLLARVEGDGRWAASGARTFPEWAAQDVRGSVGTARRSAALGKALDGELPATRRAVAAGEITLEHAEILTRIGPTSDARRAALASDRPDRNEAFLVNLARRVGADEFRKVAKRWAVAVDAPTAETEHGRAAAAEHLTLARRADGMALSGFLTAEHADVLITALRAVGGVPSAGDPRSADERRAHSLADLARVALDAGVAGAGKALVRPHISVHVDWTTYRQLAEEQSGPGRAAGADGALLPPAELDDGEPLVPSAFARIACDSEVTRIVFGPDAQPLDVGRTKRTFTREQRRAVIARDRHCQFPGCDRPPVLCEVHHVTWWSRGGLTAVDNGVLLCWYHHEHVHRRGLMIEQTGGMWQFRRVDGSLIGRGPTPDSQPAPECRPAGDPDGPPAPLTCAHDDTASSAACVR